jgi:pyruvate formate lyase activating enzyme
MDVRATDTTGSVRFADQEVYMIAVEGGIGGFVRPLDCLELLGRPLRDARILNIGRCNFRCPFCFRGAHRQTHGIVDGASRYSVAALREIVDDAVRLGQFVKISGGDPCTEPALALCLARYVKDRGGKVAIGHNGSDPAFITAMVPYLDLAAIDIKGTPEQYRWRTGLETVAAARFYESSLEAMRILSEHEVVLDIRTIIPNDTTADDLERIACDLAQLPLVWERTFWTLRMYDPIPGCGWLPAEESTARHLVHNLALNHPEMNIGLRVKTIACSRIERFPRPSTGE